MKILEKIDPYRKIRAYHVALLLQLTDWTIIFPFLKYLQHKTSSSLKLDYLGDRKEIEKDIRHGAFFMTNHRDIVMDSAWLSLLLRCRYNIRPYIGMGNNLFGRWWIEILARYNRCFVVIRGVGLHAALENAKLLSSYLRYLRGRHKSIWLAQREGRAKDGNDRTQPAVLKMLTMALGEEPSTEGNSFLEIIRELNICPVSINYEYDPCDYLKARELQLRRDNPRWHKSPKDDLVSMSTGIWGQKGRVVYRLTPSINHWLDAHREELEAMSKSEQIQAVADRIDLQIHRAYEIYERGEAFEKYLNSQIEKIDIENRDEAFLRETIVKMYEYAVKNHEASNLCGEL